MCRVQDRGAEAWTENCGSHGAGAHSTMCNISLNNNRGNLERMRAKAKTILRALEEKYSRFMQWLSPLPYNSTDGKDVFNLGEEIYPCLCTHKRTPTYIHTIFKINFD